MLDINSSVGQNIRGVFFIDPANKVRGFCFYPNEVGRNVEEIKRTLVALQTNYNDNQVLLPANWQLSEDVMVPYLDDSQKNTKGNLLQRYYNVAWFMTYKQAKQCIHFLFYPICDFIFFFMLPGKSQYLICQVFLCERSFFDLPKELTK